MTNESLKKAFERMWQHTQNAIYNVSIPTFDLRGLGDFANYDHLNPNITDNEGFWIPYDTSAIQGASTKNGVIRVLFIYKNYEQDIALNIHINNNDLITGVYGDGNKTITFTWPNDGIIFTIVYHPYLLVDPTSKDAGKALTIDKDGFYTLSKMASSWNDLTDKPFSDGIEIVIDPATFEPTDVFEQDGTVVCSLTDQITTKEDVLGATLSGTMGGQNLSLQFTQEDIFFEDDNILIALIQYEDMELPIFIAAAAGTYTIPGAEPITVTVPNKGFYTFAEVLEVFTAISLTKPAKKIDEKYLPTISYNDLTNKPTIPSVAGLATETYVDQKVADIVDSSPEALNTLNELAAALGDDPNFATTIATQIGNKANVKHTHAKSEITDFPTSMPASDVPAWAKASTKPSYTASEVGALPISGGTLTGILYTTASTPLFIGSNGKVGMRASTSDKANVGQINVSNAWYNNGNQWGSQISAYNGVKNAYNEFRVSHNGLEYNCDDGKTYTVLHTGNIGSQSIAASKVTGLATVATSGSYNDLSNKPTIPTVNNATLTIQKNGTKVAEFTANSSSNVTANITVPTGAAADKGVDASIATASTSTNLPTSKAVAAFVEGKGYITSYNNGYHTTGSWNGLTYTATANGGAGELKFTVPTGTSSTTVAVGNHTHKYAGSSSAGGAATTALACTGNSATATKVNSKLTIKLNGGSTEGTNLFTFDGSAAKTLNITASSIGAAPAYTYQTTDPGAGSSLATGKLLIIYS